MIIKQAEYIGSFVRQDQCPTDERPEYAFIGRSNVGKSSLINYLVGQKELAKVSKRPGKTQTINYFLVNEEWYLVDLPGYGYAKVSQQQRASWQKMIEYYLNKRQTLQCAFVLIDSNIPLQAIDLNFLNWLGEKQIPFVIVFTKCDRLSKNSLEKNLKGIKAELSKYWHTLPPHFRSSATKGEGREEILEFIASVNLDYFEFLEQQ
jgi:GTP-binding protein